MPTGYTSKLMEQGQTFPEFVMSCARAFGACVEMRGDPSEALEKAQSELTALQAMADDLKIGFGKAKQRESIAGSKKYLAEMQVENQRLADMKAQVEKWTPPTNEHNGVKTFMLEQIEVSLNLTDYTEESIREDESKSPIDFYNEALAAAKDSIEYHTKKAKEEVERADDRSEWVQQLRNSLKT